MGGNLVRNKSIFGAVVLLDSRADDALKPLAANPTRVMAYTRSWPVIPAVGFIAWRRRCACRLALNMLTPRDVGEVVVVLILAAVRHSFSIGG